MVGSIFSLLFFLLFAVLGVFLAYISLRLIILAIRTRPKRKASFKRKFKHFLYQTLYTPIFKPWDAFKWVLYDIFSGKDRFKLFGIWAFTGYFGQGKTLGAVTLAKRYQQKYPHKRIHIYSNFEIKGQDGKVTSWEDILDLPRRTILIFDEMQSTFTSQKFKDFPVDLLWKLTQCRKQELMVFCSTPVFNRLAIQIRENVDFIVKCQNILSLDRYFRYSFWHAPDFEHYQENPIKLTMHRKFVISVVPTNKDFRQYNTEQQVDRWDVVTGETKSLSHNEIQREKSNQMKDLGRRLQASQK